MPLVNAGKAMLLPDPREDATSSNIIAYQSESPMQRHPAVLAHLRFVD